MARNVDAMMQQALGSQAAAMQGLPPGATGLGDVGNNQSYQLMQQMLQLQQQWQSIAQVS